MLSATTLQQLNLDSFLQGTQVMFLEKFLLWEQAVSKIVGESVKNQLQTGGL